MKIDRLAELLEFLKTTPNEPFLLYAVALEYQKKGDLGNALKYFTELTQSHPDYLGTYYQLGKFLEDINDHDSAMEAYKKGIEVAKAQGNQKTLSELKGALMNLEMDL